jgi:hypothetical protein
MHPQIMTESFLWAGGQTQSLDSVSVEVLNTVDELSAAIKDIWKNLSVDYIQGLYHSIAKRLRKVLKVKGEMTKY